MLRHHQLHHAFIVQVVTHIHKHLVDEGLPTGNDFQTLAIGVEVILFVIVDRHRNVRISTEVLLEDIVVMDIERLAVHDGLQMLADVVADNDKHVRRVVLRILRKNLNGVPDRILGLFRGQQHLVPPRSRHRADSAPVSPQCPIHRTASAIPSTARTP